MNTDKYIELGKVFADFLERGRRVYDADSAPAAPAGESTANEPVVVTGAALVADGGQTAKTGSPSFMPE